MTCGVVHLQFISFSAGTIETSNCITTGLLAASIQYLTLVHVYYKLGSNLGKKVVFSLLTTTSCFTYESESREACTSEATWCIDTYLLTVVTIHSTFIDI